MQTVRIIKSLNEETKSPLLAAALCVSFNRPHYGFEFLNAFRKCCSRNYETRPWEVPPTLAVQQKPAVTIALMEQLLLNKEWMMLDE